MTSLSARLKKACFVSLLAATALALPAHAGDHGGGGAPEPIKLTVNLGQGSEDVRYLQIEIVFEASPEALQSINGHKPKVLHQLILLLSDETREKLLTLKGKKELAEKIASAVNKTIDADAKSGVHEVLFPSFIIQ